MLEHSVLKNLNQLKATNFVADL